MCVRPCVTNLTSLFLIRRSPPAPPGLTGAEVKYLYKTGDSQSVGAAVSIGGAVDLEKLKACLYVLGSEAGYN